VYCLGTAIRSATQHIPAFMQLRSSSHYSKYEHIESRSVTHTSDIHFNISLLFLPLPLISLSPSAIPTKTLYTQASSHSLACYVPV